MIRRVSPGQRSGSVCIPASKSQAHRLLICAAMGEKETEIICDGISRDIEATICCLNALGASIRDTGKGTLLVLPVRKTPTGLCELSCGESGSTLRFLLPLVGALGADAVFIREGRLPQRPLAPLDSELNSHGMSFSEVGAKLFCSGQLRPGAYTLPGNVSSQYISGLLMALPFLDGDSTLAVTGNLESSAYITMTEDALGLSGIELEKKETCYHIPGGQKAVLPPHLQVEGDFSNAAFFLCAGALSKEGITVEGLNLRSSQGDRAILDILSEMGANVQLSDSSVFVCDQYRHGTVIDAAPIPDLIPVLSVLASVSEGETRIVHAARLRLKESDRLRSTTELLRSRGADVTELEDGLVIQGKTALHGGTIDSFGDHRIAMSAAVAAMASVSPVEITGAECVQKSYPRFWEDFDTLYGGKL